MLIDLAHFYNHIKNNYHHADRPSPLPIMLIDLAHSSSIQKLIIYAYFYNIKLFMRTFINIKSFKSTTRNYTFIIPLKIIIIMQLSSALFIPSYFMY